MEEGTREQAHEQVPQRGTPIQGLVDSRLANGPIMSYEGLNEELCPPAAVHKIDREMVLMSSGFKSETEPLDWDAFFNR